VIRLRGRPSTPVTIQCGAGPADQVEEALFGHPLSVVMKTQEVAGALRAACDGTLLLVDVDQLSLHAQAWLYWTVDELSRSGSSPPPRLIATTSLSIGALDHGVETGALRADLFGMLRVWSVEIPPLRHRRQDIPVLVGCFVRSFEAAQSEVSSGMGSVSPLVVDPALMWALIDHPWPRNVDQLRSVVEAACVEAAASGGQLTSTARLQRLIGDLPRTANREPGAVTDLAAPRSRSELLAVLREHDFVISRVADHFGKHRQQVYRWMERFEIDPRRRGVGEGTDP
jgi:DNA-binding NtrC family response regulator